MKFVAHTPGEKVTVSVRPTYDDEGCQALEIRFSSTPERTWIMRTMDVELPTTVEVEALFEKAATVLEKV